MPSDISRTSDEQQYQGVVMQQGRVILDRDFNALQKTLERRIEADALDFVGPCGTPDNGFAIDAPITPASPPLWTPPSPLSPPGPTTPYDFSISPGTMYVGGQRAVFPPYASGQGAVGYSYFDQPDWISPEPPGTNPAKEFIYLHLFEQEVSAVEDPELKDVALGGPDTTQRIRLVKRVKRMKVSAADCASAQSSAATQWQQKGLAFYPQTMRLVPQATLLVTASTPDTNPSDPAAQGGYLGAENQLIRVQISDGGVPNTTPTLLWGCDNASSLYRATVSSPPNSSGPTTLVLGQSPVDAFHTPQQGQVVEVLRWALVIDTELDETNPQQPGGIVRCVAEARGFVSALSGPYQTDTRTISLSASLPTEYTTDTNPLFVRIWQNQLPFTAGTALELTYVNGNTTGVQVTVGIPSGQAPIGAYWMLAVRPSTPQAVYPERFLVSPQPPDGPRQWACPLAVIDWTASTTSPVGPPIVNCRHSFNGLTTPTPVPTPASGLCGQCTVQLCPNDVTGTNSLQAVLDRFKSRNPLTRGVTICLMPGTYDLPAPLVLGHLHSNITLEGCQDGVVLRAAPGSETAFVDGLIVLHEANEVTLRGLRFHLPRVPFKGVGGRLAGMTPKLTASLKLTALREFDASIAVRPIHCANLVVRDCLFRFELGENAAAGKSAVPAALFAVGIFAGSECWGLRVDACRFLHSADYLQQDKSGSEDPTLPPRILLGFALAPAVTIHNVEPIKSQPRQVQAAREQSPNYQLHEVTGTYVTALLQDAVFRDNTFSGLSAGLVVIADTGSLRLEDNLLRLCYAGFCLSSASAASASPLIQEILWGNLEFDGKLERGWELAQQIFYATTDPLLEQACVLCRAYPTPAGFSPERPIVVATAETYGELQDAASDLVKQLECLGQACTAASVGAEAAVPESGGPESRMAEARTPEAPAPPEPESAIARIKHAATELVEKIESLGSSKTKAPATAAASVEFNAPQIFDELLSSIERRALATTRGRQKLTPALALGDNEVSASFYALYVAGALTDCETPPGCSSLIVSANKMHSQTDVQVPTVLVVALDRIIAMGNLICNDGPAGDQGPYALFFYPEGDCEKAPVAVTGNVLGGTSNLSRLKTGHHAPVENWAYANTRV